ncbi:MAG: flagellar motor protein MotA, partial [Spongiibacter sp.]
MNTSLSLGIMHSITTWLLEPVVWGLLLFVVLAVYESGLAIGERFGGIRRLSRRGQGALLEAGKRRIERADFITRLAP